MPHAMTFRPRRHWQALGAGLALAASPAAPAYTDAELDARFATFHEQLQAAQPKFSANGYVSIAGSVTD